MSEGRRQALRWAMGLGLGLGLGVNTLGSRALSPAAFDTARPTQAPVGSQASPILYGRERDRLLHDRDSTLPLHWRERALLAFGTTVSMRAAHAQASVVDAALDAALAAVQRVDQQMSLFRPDSAICQLNRDGVLHQPDADLVALLRLARQVAERSAGSFDPTVQPLWRLWQRAHAQGRRPTAAELRAARALVGWQGLHVNDASIALARPGMAITLNGIAQGHAADQARQALLRHGVVDALLDTGEWLPMGSAPRSDPQPEPKSNSKSDHASGQDPKHSEWRLGVADPHHALQLLGALEADGRALACSSDDKLFFSADRRDHHILNPRTGRSPTQLSTVVVAAPSAALADALTKPMFMGSLADALALARRWQVDVLAVDKMGRIAASRGLHLTHVG